MQTYHPEHFKFINGTSVIYRYYWNTFIENTCEFVKDFNNIASIGCGNFQIEQEIINRTGVKITGFDPYGSNCIQKEFTPSDEYDCIMVLYPYYEQHEDMYKINYDYRSLKGCKNAVILYGKCGHSGSEKLINEMNEEKPFGINKAGEFEVVEGTGFGFMGAISNLVFLGEKKMETRSINIEYEI